MSRVYCMYLVIFYVDNAQSIFDSGTYIQYMSAYFRKDIFMIFSLIYLIRG